MSSAITLDICEILEELRSTSGRKDKLEILEREKHNINLKEFFRLTYCPKQTYFLTLKGLSEWQESDKFTEASATDVAVQESFKELTSNQWQCILHLLDHLNSRKISGDEKMAEVSLIHQNLKEDGREVLERIIDRDARCGVSDSTINKVWPNLIYVPRYQGATSLNAKSASKFVFDEKNGAFSECKEDGVFLNTFVLTDGVRFETRNGSDISGDAFPDTVKQEARAVKQRSGMKECVIISEFVIKDLATGELLERADGNGLINSLIQTGEKLDDSKYYIQFRCWDIIPYDAYMLGQYPVPRHDRRKLLEVATASLKHIVPVECRIVANINEALSHFEELASSGKEGTILKEYNAIWKNGKPKEQLKLKVIVQSELKIVGKNPGNGKHANTFGSLILETEDGLLQVGCSGFTDDMRQEISDNWESDWLGTVVDCYHNGIQYNNDIDTPHSVFLPRFKGQRLDKKEADSLQKVIDDSTSSVFNLKHLFKNQ